MPCAYQLFAIEKFPGNNKLRTEEQLTLEYSSEQSREHFASSLDLVETVDESFSKYSAEHDFLFHLEFYGRAKGTLFREFVTPYKFSVYRGRADTGLGFTPLITRTKKKVASDFIDRLNRNLPGFTVQRVRLDFDLLRPRLQMVRGAWFARLRQPNISSTAVFGANVDRSDEFKHAENFGHLTNLMVEVEHDGLAHTVMLGADCALVLYQNYQSETDELHLVRAMHNDLLAGCVTIRERSGS